MALIFSLFAIWAFVMSALKHGDTSLLYAILGFVLLLHAEAESKR